MLCFSITGDGTIMSPEPSTYTLSELMSYRTVQEIPTLR